MGEEALEPQTAPEQRHRHHQHADPREDRPDDEVGPEDRALPARRPGHREVPGHDRVHRDRDRNDRHRQDADPPLQAVPLLRGAAPAERQDGVEALPESGRRAVPHHGRIRNQRQEQVERAADDVGRDRGDVPDQGRAEVGPQHPAVGVGDHVVEDRHPAEVNQREEAADREREQRDRLRRTGHRPPPLRLRHPQDRRDQRAGVADADPEDEVDDVEAPEHRPVDAGDADAVRDLVAPAVEKNQDQGAACEGAQEQTGTAPVEAAQQLAVERGSRALGPTRHSTGARHSEPLR